MFGERGAEPVFVDWQLASARNGALDLAWLLVLGVPTGCVPERRNVWLGRYRDRLGLDVEAFGRAHALGVAACGQGADLDGRRARQRAHCACRRVCRGDDPESIPQLSPPRKDDDQWLT